MALVKVSFQVQTFIKVNLNQSHLGRHDQDHIPSIHKVCTLTAGFKFSPIIVTKKDMKIDCTNQHR